ncbi:hypothetical protein ACH4F6_31725 [Streptomyces sp. NPDC017936]|uniref:hypothetical protein n=1 Tax=Streptomyces sp. NPDC017936 TaxID=3365016 RepID=UPI0037AF4197
MTIVDFIPALKAHGRRRVQDQVRELKGEVARLTDWQAAADDFFEQQDRNMTALERELADERKARKLAEKALARAEAVIRLREEEIDGLKRTAGIRAQAENVITETQEIDMRGLLDRFRDGPVRSLHHSPQAAPPDPAA